MDDGVSSGVEVVGVYRNDSLSDEHGAAMVVVAGEAGSAFLVLVKKRMDTVFERKTHRDDEVQFDVFIVYFIF